MERQLSKAFADIQLWKTRYETEGVARCEEIDKVHPGAVLASHLILPGLLFSTFVLFSRETKTLRSSAVEFVHFQDKAKVAGRLAEAEDTISSLQ